KRARFWASCPAAEYRRRVASPRLAHTFSVVVWIRGEHGAGVVADMGWISTPTRGLPAHSWASAHDFGGAGVEARHAEVGHARLAAARDDVLAHAQRVVGGGQKCVAPAVHRRGARVVGLPQVEHARAAHAHDRLGGTD